MGEQTFFVTQGCQTRVESRAEFSLRQNSARWRFFLEKLKYFSKSFSREARELYVWHPCCNRLNCMTGEEGGGCECSKKTWGNIPSSVKIQSSLNLKKGTGNIHSSAWWEWASSFCQLRAVSPWTFPNQVYYFSIAFKWFFSLFLSIHC